MRILEIVSGGEINGAVIHCALLSRELARRGHDVTLLCRTGARVIQLMAAEPVQIIESDMHRFPFDELRRISSLAHDAGIQILHTHMTRAHNFGVLLRRFSGIPCVATAHSHIVQPATWMFNDHVIAVSEATRRFQQSHNLVRPARIETVHGFADFDCMASIELHARDSVRAELGLAPETPVAGIIGDIIPRKGHIYLFRAFAQVVREIPGARLLIVGEPKRSMGKRYHERILRECVQLGIEQHLVWAGYRGDVPRVMRALDVYVLASLDEMFPVAALEAMAAGMPIVATAVGGVPECLVDDETALLVPPAEPAPLAKAIARLLIDRSAAARLAAEAQARAREEFSLASQTPRIEAVFERVLQRFRPAASLGRSSNRRP